MTMMVWRPEKRNTGGAGNVAYSIHTVVRGGGREYDITVNTTHETAMKRERERVVAFFFLSFFFFLYFFSSPCL